MHGGGGKEEEDGEESRAWWLLAHSYSQMILYDVMNVATELNYYTGTGEVSLQGPCPEYTYLPTYLPVLNVAWVLSYSAGCWIEIVGRVLMDYHTSICINLVCFL